MERSSCATLMILATGSPNKGMQPVPPGVVSSRQWIEIVGDCSSPRSQKFSSSPLQKGLVSNAIAGNISRWVMPMDGYLISGTRCLFQPKELSRDVKKGESTVLQKRKRKRRYLCQDGYLFL